MVFENNTTIEYTDDTPDGDDDDGREEDDIAAESSSNGETLVLISRYLLYLYVEYKDDQAECVVTGHGIGDYANVWHNQIYKLLRIPKGEVINFSILFIVDLTNNG